jgi:hypothetical protein
MCTFNFVTLETLAVVHKILAVTRGKTEEN